MFSLALLGFNILHNFRTDSDSDVRQPIVTRYEKELNSDGQNLVAVLHTLYTEDRNFKENIDSAMSAAFGDEFEEFVDVVVQLQDCAAVAARGE